MNSLKQQTQTIFRREFNYEPLLTVQAPGRVNLIGEHTDYNDGFVLPCAIDYQTVISCAPRSERVIRVVAADYDNQCDTFSLDEDIEPHADYRWANYVRGVVKYLQRRNANFAGVDMVISGNVPQGAGLSSSASLEVAIGKAIQLLYKLPLSAAEIALNGQEAENKFVGCNCGIMDQLISAMGEQNQALLIDCRSLESRLVTMPEDIAVVIVNSNIKRGLVDSEYNVRRRQCEEAAKFFGVKALRDINLEQLKAAESQLPPLVFKRALHVVTENARTQQAAEALSRGDLAALGVLMEQSHNSMRDDFEITVPAINTLVDIIKQVIRCDGGVRMTGGGFGGCVVALVPTEQVDIVRRAVAEQYHSQTGVHETFYVCHASEGAREC